MALCQPIFKVITIFRKCLIKLQLYLEVCEGRKDQHWDCKKWSHFEGHILLPDSLLPLQRHVQLKCPVVVAMLLETGDVQQSLIGNNTTVLYSTFTFVFGFQGLEMSFKILCSSGYYYRWLNSCRSYLGVGRSVWQFFLMLW